MEKKSTKTGPCGQDADASRHEPPTMPTGAGPDCDNCNYKRFAANWRNGQEHDAKLTRKVRSDTIWEILKFFKFGCPGGPLNPICDMCGANQYCRELSANPCPLGMVGAPDAPAGASAGAVSEDFCKKKGEE